MKTEQSLQCPSYVAKSGAELFGIVGQDGTVNYLDEPIRVDQSFVDAAKARQAITGQAAEERFRFAGKCIQGKCGQWDHGHSACSLVGRVIDAMNRQADQLPVPCAIRSRCRWYSQAGADACANCSEVVRNAEQRRLADQPAAL
ncbi:hypothetical protein [Spirosoma sp. KUDC1026]|uniref:hypothetical protein n=1 Tax=Spirosoma sp. KUDC1026 TaxID=2745947 RepID=UPI00159BEA97|nr:hypothetical protein [Spirosoma sp. KUDC1026]QKZ11292.1 hypothetical protein HU175_01025 [Spirosoma sp. KUDC1026]